MLNHFNTNMDKRVKIIYYMKFKPTIREEIRSFFSYPYVQEYQGIIWLLNHMGGWTFYKQKIFAEHLAKILKNSSKINDL